jgi:hypothetical protein
VIPRRNRPACLLFHVRLSTFKCGSHARRWVRAPLTGRAAVRSHADAYMARFDFAQARAPRRPLKRGRARGRRSCGCTCCFLVVLLAVMYRRSCFHDATSPVQITFPFASGAPVTPDIVSQRTHSASLTLLPADDVPMNTTWFSHSRPRRRLRLCGSHARRADPLPSGMQPSDSPIGPH